MARLESAHDRAQQAAQTVDVELGSLYVEARTVGLIEGVDSADRSELVRALQGARVARPNADLSGVDSPAEQDRRQALVQRRDALSLELRVVMENRVYSSTSPEPPASSFRLFASRRVASLH